MIRFAFLFILGLSSSFLAASKDAQSLDTIPLYTITSHEAFQNGEELNFSLNYGFVKGGEACLSVKDVQLNGQRVQHVVGLGKTVGLADAIYKVRDQYESYINPTNGLPVKSVRNIQEGRYRYYNEVLFDHDSSKVTSQKSGDHFVHPDILDMVSAIYFARNHKINDDLKEGEIIEFMTYFSDKLFPLRIRYKGIETIKTDFGKVKCYVFSPVTEVGRVFTTEDDVKVWVTKDKNRIPIKIEFDIVVGSFKCELRSYKGLKHPFSSVVRQ